MTTSWGDHFEAFLAEGEHGLTGQWPAGEPGVTLSVSKATAFAMVPTSLLAEYDSNEPVPPPSRRARRRAMVERQRIRFANWACTKIGGYRRNHGEDSCGCC